MYKSSKSLQVRDTYESIGKMRGKTTFTDTELINYLEVLDQSIGFMDGINGNGNNLVSYALIILHQNLLDIARMRGLVE